MSHHRIGYFRHRFASLLSDFLLSEPYVKLPQNLNHFYYYYKKKNCAPKYCKSTEEFIRLYLFFSSWCQVEEDDDSEFHYLEQEILFIAISGIFNKRYPLYPMRGVATILKKPRFLSRIEI